MRYREMRWPCEFAVMVEQGARRAPAVLCNIARPGAMIAGAGPVAPGDRLTLGLMGRRIGAEVRWVRAGRFGVRFEAPLPADAVLAIRRVVGAHRAVAPHAHGTGQREMR